MIPYRIKDLVERRAFGVCQYLGEKMNIAPAVVRTYFIYTSFAGLGSPVLFYLIAAFWVNVRRYIRRGRSVLWE
jgi:phage shock protein PspC (stress-responsive transcriptional regulator)